MFFIELQSGVWQLIAIHAGQIETEGNSRLKNAFSRQQIFLGYSY